MTIGERLRAARRERNMSLADLARETKLSRGFISQVESGRSNPSLASLRKLTASLGLPAGAFFDDAQDAGMPPSKTLEQGIQSSLRPNHHSVQLFSLDHTSGLDCLPIGDGGLEDLAALLSLPVRSGAFGSAPSLMIRGMAFCAVLRGTVRITHESRAIVARQGEVAAFDPGGAYSITCAADTDASIFLTLPSGCQLPTLSDLNLVEQSVVRPLAASGPFRLVEMRAAIRAAGRAYRR
ncbi:MAG TPA: helix-turn-helix transcriptional regulator [Chloroflexia bacterium]|nr:helix-turn-helix transcriptional regulator [Chloroflexia bacterium]